jgi:hypothetical protein
MAGLTILQIVKVYADDIAAWARSVGGTCVFARDPLEPWELIAGMGPNEFRVVVNWAGDSEFGGNVMQHLDRHTIEIWLARTRGLERERDKQILQASGTTPALLDLVEAAKQRVLELKFAGTITRKYTAYKGTVPVTTPEGIPMAAYKISVTLDAAGRDIVYRDVPLPS